MCASEHSLLSLLSARGQSVRAPAATRGRELSSESLGQHSARCFVVRPCVFPQAVRELNWVCVYTAGRPKLSNIMLDGLVPLLDQKSIVVSLQRED